jgi:SAM-dependent methyltransferase
MTPPKPSDNDRYLNAKVSVDDRAINQRVFSRLLRCLPPSSFASPLRVLELGAGIGTMVERLMDWGALQHADYTLLDMNAGSIEVAHQRLETWARSQSLQKEEPENCDLSLRTSERSLRLSFIVEDVNALPGAPSQEGVWDLLLAHAFLDLVDLPSLLRRLLRLLKNGGLFYFTLNFDGATLFEPSIDPALDAEIERLYHQTMDRRLKDGQPSGSSRTGRDLLRLLPEAGGEILSAGASDWVVFPSSSGYPHDEAYFLHHIVHTIDEALTGNPELDQGRLYSWIHQRHQQIERHELVYIAHQVDILGARQGSPAENGDRS